MYKLSKYTIAAEALNGDLLLYNTLIGKRSLCKLQGIFANMDYLEKCVNDPSKNHELVSELIRRGIIIDSNLDEKNALYASFIENLTSPNLILHINPTEECNFRCTYCYETFSNGKMSEQTQNNLIRFVKQNIHKYTGLNISWFGGEPLLALDCIEKLTKEFKAICRYNRIPYSAVMTTNAFLLNEGTFEKLLDLDVRQYQITVDGMKCVHDKQRVLADGRGTYDKIKDNIKGIHENKRKDFEIIIRSNITRDILDNIDMYIQEIESICGGDSRFVFDFHKVGNWMGRANESIVPKIINDLGDFKFVYDKLLYSSFTGRINFSSYYPGNGSCYAGKMNQFLVRANGEFHKCTVDFESDGTRVGTMHDGNLELNDQYYSSIVKIGNCDSFYKCFFAPICMGMACPKDNGKSCPYTKEYIKDVLKILDKNYPLDII